MEGLLPGLRVALDVSAAIVGVGGIRAYSMFTWRELRTRPEITVVAFAAGRGTTPNLPLRRLPVPLRALQLSWRLTGMPRAETITGGADIVHSFDLMPPPTRRPLVVTVHDVLTLTHPGFFSPEVRRQQQAHIEGARRASVVITSCQSTARAIAEVVGVAPERIVVTPFGPALSHESDAGRERIDPPPARSPADGPYILSVGTIEPRKGYEVLAAAANKVRECPPVLVAGADGWRANEVRDRVRMADRRALVKFLGAVDEHQLGRLYRGATIVCQPTLAEGFGLPVLEAMSFGKAVVASDIPPLREIGAGAVELVAPGQADALAAAIEMLIGEPERLHDLGQRAQSAAVPWTWQRGTERLLGAYRMASGG